MHISIGTCVSMNIRTFPDNLINQTIFSKNLIHSKADKGIDSPITLAINAAILRQQISH